MLCQPTLATLALMLTLSSSASPAHPSGPTASLLLDMSADPSPSSGASDHASMGGGVSGSSSGPTVVFRSNFTEPAWVAIYHIPVLLAVPLPRQGGWRMMAFAEARECGRGGGQTCDPGLAPDGAPKGLAFRYSDWAPNATNASAASWLPALGTAPR